MNRQNSYGSAIVLGTALLMCCYFVGSPAQAGEVAYEGELQLIYPIGDGSFALGFVPTNSALTPCSSSGSTKYVFVTPTQGGVTEYGAKNLLATALTAFAMGKSVGVVFDDSSTSCFVKRLSMQQ